jgi:WD40 repeat protein
MLMDRLGSAKILAGHRGVVGSVAIGPNGDIGISGAYRHFGAEGEIRIWDLSTGEQMREIQTGLNAIFSLAVSPDSRNVIAGGGGVVAADRATGVTAGRSAIETCGERKPGGESECCRGIRPPY